MSNPSCDLPHDYQVVVVGNGLGGLAAGFGAASEGLRTLILDEDQEVGGQAGTSSLIENFPGFPEGISGTDLAGRLIEQARGFRADFRAPFRVTRIHRDLGGLITLTGADRNTITCFAAVLATGVSYKTLDALNIGPYIGRGVSYGSPNRDPTKWEKKRVGIVGAANSAGQAARYLAGCHECKVHIFARGETLEDRMSNFQIDIIKSIPNIVVHYKSEVNEVIGDSKALTGVRLKKNGVTEKRVVPLDHLFVQIGATPHTSWLDGTVALDKNGFILTDRDLPEDQWLLAERRPFSYETSVPGVFAIGDNRAGSVKRASTATGEGIGAVPNIHQYLSEMRLLNGTC